MGTILRLFESYASNAIDRTFEAIVEEHAKPNGQSTNGDIRKRPAAPARAAVQSAFRLQAQDGEHDAQRSSLATARRHARLDREVTSAPGS